MKTKLYQTTFEGSNPIVGTTLLASSIIYVLKIGLDIIMMKLFFYYTSSIVILDIDDL
jgi:hypothetical protein